MPLALSADDDAGGGDRCIESAEVDEGGIDRGLHGFPVTDVGLDRQDLLAEAFSEGVELDGCCQRITDTGRHVGAAADVDSGNALAHAAQLCNGGGPLQ